MTGTLLAKVKKDPGLEKTNVNGHGTKGGQMMEASKYVSEVRRSKALVFGCYFGAPGYLNVRARETLIIKFLGNEKKYHWFTDPSAGISLV